MEFVTFHVGLGSGEAVHPNQTLDSKAYLRNIDLMLRSARVFHPDMKATVLTDLHTDLSSLSFSVKRVTSAMNPRRLMLERALAELRYVQESELSVPMVLLDSDILINGTLAHLCGQAFDVAVTWRPDPNMPINGGFLIMNNQRPEVSKKFFAHFVSLYLNRYADKADWFGDQFALRDCIGLGSEQMIARKAVEIDGCRVLLLPCDSYNFSPNNQYQSICSILSEKVVIHFKGQRKRLMVPYWRAWLKPAHSPLPWVKVSGWLMRRWLKRQSERERCGAVGDLEKCT